MREKEFSMTTAGAERAKITVLVRQPSGPPRRFRRPLAGLTLSQAIDVLADDESFPGSMPPDLVNNKEVGKDYVLQPGDILSVEDP